MPLKDDFCVLYVYLSFPQSIKFKSSFALPLGARGRIRSFGSEEKQWAGED